MRTTHGFIEMETAVAWRHHPLFLRCLIGELRIASFLGLLLACMHLNVAEAKTRPIANVLAPYTATLDIAEAVDKDAFKPGVIRVFDRKGREIVKVEADELPLGLEETSSKEQDTSKLIIQQDFNFDGVGDMAIMDGQNSCYHGPSYKVFVGDKTGSLHPDEALTDLAQEYCGMFEIDHARKRLTTMAKSGCCDHLYVEFAVENGVPRKVKTVEEGAAYYAPYPTFYLETALRNGLEETAVARRQMQDPEEISADKWMKINLADGRRIQVLVIEHQLFYAISKKDGDVEFLYPDRETQDASGHFIYSPESKRLRFSHGSASYAISVSGDDARIEVDIGGKQYVYQGVTAGGSDLKELTSGYVENLERVALSHSFPFEDFSSQFLAEIRLTDEADSPNRTSADYRITRKSDGALVAERTGKIGYSLCEQLMEAGIVAFPKNGQHPLHYDDYNFDGVKDFAFLVDDESETYAVYLRREGDTLEYSERFSEMTRDVGLFDVQPSSKTLVHGAYIYRVQNDLPVLVRDGRQFQNMLRALRD